MTLHVRRAVSHVHAAAVIFQLLVDFVPNFFLQKMIRNDVLSDRKALQRFRDIENDFVRVFWSDLAP